MYIRSIIVVIAKEVKNTFTNCYCRLNANNFYWVVKSNAYACVIGIQNPDYLLKQTRNHINNINSSGFEFAT
jgi:hypothetical protein